MRADFFRPLPVKSEAVGPAEPTVLELIEPDVPIILDESERMLSADDLYRVAHEDTDPEMQGQTRPRTSRARPMAPGVQPGVQSNVQLWGSGTSGRPGKGSRTIRLFSVSPSELVQGLRSSRASAALALEHFEQRRVGSELELFATGQLIGAFRLRPTVPVRVSARVLRFNSSFSAFEVTLESKRHPRRFFRAAHDAIEALNLPGR